MLSARRIPLKKELLNPLVYDYLTAKKELTDLYSHFPDRTGFRNAIEELKKFKFDRSLLVNELIAQSKKAENTSSITVKNIEGLNNPNSFTITTGHQL